MEFFIRHFSILSKKEHALVLVSHDDHGNKYRARKIEDRDKPFALLSMEGGEQFVFRVRQYLHETSLHLGVCDYYFCTSI